MCPEHLAQGLMYEMCCRMVGGAAGSVLFIYTGGEYLCRIGGNAVGQMDRNIVLPLCVENLDSFPVFAGKCAGVAHLATHFGIERCFSEHYLVIFLSFLPYLAVSEYGCLGFGAVVAYKLHIALTYLHPVGGFRGGGVAGTLFLLLHLSVESGLVYAHSLLAQYEFGEVKGESVCVIKQERILSGDFIRALGPLFADLAVKHSDTVVESAEERIFFLLDYLFDKFFLCRKFGVGATHLCHQCVDKLIKECLALTEECVYIPYRAAQNTADHISGLGVGGELGFCYGERNGAHVVGCDTHRHIGFLVLSIFLSGKLAYLADQRCEYIRVVIGRLSLESHAEAFETHAGVYHFGGKRFQMAVGFSVVLHENKIPYLDHQRIVLVDERGAVRFGAFLIWSQVYVDLAARTAWAGLAHLPEIVMTVAVDDMRRWKMPLPDAGGLVVPLESLRGIAFEDCGVKAVWIQLQHIHQIFPCPVYGLLLEVVSKRPVAEHLEHRMVVCVVSNLLEVVVLPRYAQTFLAVGHSPAFRHTVAKDYILELIHSGVGKHQRRVIL